MTKTVSYNGRPNCLELSNGDAQLIISTDFGPRILSYALDGGDNILGWHPDAGVDTALGRWKPYGGHRLWMAPENMPLSYAPDNDPVAFSSETELSVRLTPPADENAGIQKEIMVTLDGSGSRVTIEHSIANCGGSEIEISAWALTIMRGGGEAIIPNEPFEPYGAENLLPIRSMAIWSYTDLTDHRWSFEKDRIRLRVDDASHSPQKFGVLNKQGWAGYKWKDLLFVKRFEYVPGALYPDMNSNVEVYTDGGFVEVETLSPLKKLARGQSVHHREIWELYKDTVSEG